MLLKCTKSNSKITNYQFTVGMSYIIIRDTPQFIYVIDDAGLDSKVSKKTLMLTHCRQIKFCEDKFLAE